MSFNRSRSLLRGKIFRSIDRVLYRDSPYCRDRRNNRQDSWCNKCKRPGHFARECPNVTVCNNCGLPGHIAAKCNSFTMCWNCKEPGHLPGQCPSEPVCNMCGKMGHLARDCLNPRLPAPDARLCNKCYKAGHFATDCTNEKACNNCRKTGLLARDCPNEPVCNICNISGHVARQCAKSKLSSDMGGRFRTFFAATVASQAILVRTAFPSSYAITVVEGVTFITSALQQGCMTAVAYVGINYLTNQLL